MIHNNAVAIQHFRKHQDKAPNAVQNHKGPWKGLSPEEIEEDIRTADFVPNRAAWRRSGLRGRDHAISLNLQ